MKIFRLMQKNVCLQQDICLYPDKTLQKLVEGN